MNSLSVVFVLACATVAFASTLPAEFSEWEGRIVGGTAAGEGQFPYQVSLRGTVNNHFCGGSIVNTRWALTAAHCTIGRTAASTRVVVGTNSRTTGGITHTVSRIVNHPSYNANTLANDISVVETATTIVFTALVQPIALGSTFIGGGVSVVASGWGQLSNPGSAPVALQWITTQSLTNEACRSAHTAGNAALVFDNTICTFTRTGEGMCMGDSGGPLASNNNVIGVVSWGIACARGFPDVFARVSSHRSWVIGITG